MEYKELKTNVIFLYHDKLTPLFKFCYYSSHVVFGSFVTHQYVHLAYESFMKL